MTLTAITPIARFWRSSGAETFDSRDAQSARCSAAVYPLLADLEIGTTSRSHRLARSACSASTSKQPAAAQRRAAFSRERQRDRGCEIGLERTGGGQLCACIDGLAGS
jgi:hypothetical protein